MQQQEGTQVKFQQEVIHQNPVNFQLSPFSMMNEARNPGLKQPSNQSGSSSSRSKSNQAIVTILISEMKQMKEQMKEIRFSIKQLTNAIESMKEGSQVQRSKRQKSRQRQRQRSRQRQRQRSRQRQRQRSRQRQKQKQKQRSRDVKDNQSSYSSSSKRKGFSWKQRRRAVDMIEQNGIDYVAEIYSVTSRTIRRWRSELKKKS